MSPRRPRRADQVADATLVSLAATRQAAKNLMLVRALRDATDFDREWYADAVRRELESLAVEAETDAARLGRTLQSAGFRTGRGTTADDYRAADAKALLRRRRILRDLA